MKTHRHIFGRRKSPRDRRDDKFLLPSKVSRRVYRYWSDTWISADQQQTPRCVGFAWCHWLANKPVEQFVDPDGLYAGCKLIDEAPEEDGTYVRAGAEILRQLGFIEKYEWARTLKALVYTVLELGPVVVGTDWYEGMEEGPDLQATGEILGGHAYLIIGANQKLKKFKIKNSWGKSWGDNGHAWISFDDMETLLKDDGEVALATESQPQAKWLLPS